MLFSGTKGITGKWWHGLDSLKLIVYYFNHISATPGNFCRPATPTGSLLFAAPRPERPSDPANPATLLHSRGQGGSDWVERGQPARTTLRLSRGRDSCYGIAR